MPELRPRGVGEVLDAAVSLWRARFGALMRVTLLVVVPVAFLGALILLSATPDTVSSSGAFTADGSDDGATFFAGIVVYLLLWAVASGFVLAVTTRIVADAYVDGPETTGEAARAVARRVPALVALTFLFALGVGAGVVLCYLPGIVLAAFWSVAVPAFVLEGIGPIRALGRSFGLVRSRFWAALGVFWAAVMLAGALNIGLTSLLDLAVRDTDDFLVGVIFQTVTSAVSSAITVPLTATAIVALYFDLRIRKEAFDVQMMLTRLDARRPGAVPAR